MYLQMSITSSLSTHIYVLLDFSAIMYFKVSVLILKHDAYQLYV